VPHVIADDARSASESSPAICALSAVAGGGLLLIDHRRQRDAERRAG